MNKKAKYVIKRAANDQFYFVLKAPNGKVIAMSETYKSLQGCKVGIQSCQGNARTTEVLEKL